MDETTNGTIEGKDALPAAAIEGEVLSGEEIAHLMDALRISGGVSVSGTLYSGFDATTRPDTATIRKIYHNMQADRLLGSFVAAPIVNLLAGYIGLPEVRLAVTDAPEESARLEQAFNDNASALSQIHRLTLRDGRAFLQFGLERYESTLYAADENNIGRIAIRTVLSDNVLCNRDFITGEITYAEISDMITWLTDTQEEKSGIIKTVMTPKTIEYRKGNNSHDIPDELVPPKMVNEFGFVPLVEFVNEPEAFGSYGVSEIERVDPLMRMYHDVLLAAAKGSKMHSTPKIGFYLGDLNAFINANFPDLLDQIKKGETPKIEIAGRELLLMGNPEQNKVEYIEADNPIGAAVDLLKLIFYCMVITSETPEFSLGVHMPSSYASTVEQTPIWILKVQRKQRQFTGCWQMVGRMLLAMIAKSTGKKMKSYAVRVLWSLPDGADKKQVALHQLNTVQSVLLAVDGKLMSYQTAIETLRQVFPAMETIEGGNGRKGELEEIKATSVIRNELGAEDNTDRAVAKVKPVKSDNKLKSDIGSDADATV